MNTELPKDWKWIDLGDVCIVRNGYAFKSSDYRDSGILLFRQTNLDGEKVKLKNAVYLPKEYLEIYKEYQVLKGDVLVGMSGSIGKLCTYNLDSPALQNQRTGLLKFSENVNGKIVRYYFEVLEKELQKKSKGVAVLNISAKDIQESKFPLPPFPEQQRIVAKLEELLSELEKGKEQLHTALDQLKVYRQAVLKYAFEGKLTSKVKVNNGELPEGWKLVKLGEACDKIQDGSHFSPAEQYLEDGKDRYLYITAKNIRNNYMDLSKIIYINKKFHDSIYPRCNPEFGDVLLTKDGVNTGEVTLNSLKEPFSLLSSVCLFKTKKEMLSPPFLKYYIQSPIGNKNLIGQMTGTAIKRIILKKLKGAEIVLPKLEDQQRIVEEIESRLSVADKMEETINASLQQSETLRQSILKKAFEGKLV